MSMLDDPWRMAIPNPDEVLNGAFAIDGSLSVRGIYADEIRLRKGATYSDFLTSVGTLDDYAKDATLNLVKLTLKGAEGDALPSMEPEQYRRDREEFFAWFDHFKVNIRALSADRTGETPETTGGGRIPTAPDVLPDRSDWAKTQNWALKDHFHDERYALVKHPHVKADITDWAHRHLYDDIIGGPKVPGAIPGGGTGGGSTGGGVQAPGWGYRYGGWEYRGGGGGGSSGTPVGGGGGSSGSGGGGSGGESGGGGTLVPILGTTTGIFGAALIAGGAKYYRDRKAYERDIAELQKDNKTIVYSDEQVRILAEELKTRERQFNEMRTAAEKKIADDLKEASDRIEKSLEAEEKAEIRKREADRIVENAIREAKEQARTELEKLDMEIANKVNIANEVEEGTKMLDDERKAAEEQARKAKEDLRQLELREQERQKAEGLASTIRFNLEQQVKTLTAELQRIGTAVPRGTMETQTTPRPDPRPAAERLPFARLGRSDQVEELIGLTLEDQRALFDALEQRRRADEEAAAKTEEERLKAMQTASDEEFARLEEPKKDAEELRRKMADEKWKNFERQAVQRPISDAIWIAYGDVEEMHRELRTEASLWRGALEWSLYRIQKGEFLAELRANPKTVSAGAQSAYLSMVDYVGKLSKFWEMRRAIIPAEGLAQYDAMVRDLEAFKREHPPAKYKIHIDTTAFMGDLRKRGDEAKSQIEERYRKAQADKEYANRVIEERKQQAKENAARRNAEIEEQRRKIAERKAAEEEARKTKVETEYQALKREANQILKRRGRAYADEGAGVGLASPDDITLAERDDVSVEEMRPGTARLPSEGVFQTLDRRVMGDSDVILRNALMPYGDWNRATADALADFDLERFTTKEQRDAYLGRPRARRPGGAGIDLVGAGLGGTGSRAMRRAGAAAAGLGLATAGGLLSAYQALSQGKIGEAEFFDTFRDQMIMTVGSFGLQTGMSSALSALTKMRIGTVGGLGLSILAGAIAQVIVDIINGRSAEEIVKNFFKYPVDWATDTIQFIAELSQQIYDWGVETWGDEASQLRNRINRLEGELGSGFLGVYDPSEAREMASLLAQELRLNEIKEPKELQAFIRALDNSINDYPHR
eukprot:tig00021014_g17102.t1